MPPRIPFILTGSGKTLSLLCSSLAWQQREKHRIEEGMAQYNAEMQAHAANLETQGVNLSDAATPIGPCLNVLNDPSTKGTYETNTTGETIKKEESPDPDFKVELDPGNTPGSNIKQNNTSTATTTTVKPEPGRETTTPGEGGFLPSDHPDAPITPMMPRQKPPKIFYATRTHSQIAQVVKELKRSGYTPKMTVLASKQHYCVNSHARAQTSLDEACDELLKDSKCMYFKGTAVMLNHEITREVHDIEDLCKAGKRQKGCPYFLSRKLAEDAELVFGPYNYFVDPVIRRSIGVDIDDAIVIFDEAHNIEDVARESASLDVERLTIMETHGALVRAATYNGKPEVYAPLRDLMGTILKWMEMKEQHAVAAAARSSRNNNGGGGRGGYNNNRGRGGASSSRFSNQYEPYEKLWAGPTMLQELVALGLGPDRMEPLWEAYQFAREEDEALASGARGGGGNSANVDAPGAENRSNDGGVGGGQSGSTPAGSSVKAVRVGSGALGTISRLIQVVRMLHEVSDDGGRDFRLVIKRVHHSAGGPGGDQLRVRGRLLIASSTAEDGSGTPGQLPDYLLTLSLWCLNPAVAFRQVATPAHSIILTSGTLSPLDSFASELGSPFQVRLEAPHVVNMARQVWAGALGAGPSGEQLLATYQHTNNPPFQDAVGSAVVQVCRIIPDGVLLFLPSYSLLDKLTSRWKVTGVWSRLSELKVLVQEPRTGGAEALQAVMKEYYSAIATGRGGLFMAVCRGKVSEGLDFADANARGVLVVGIPFPNVKDTKVEAKRKFNDAGARTLGLLPGSVWYEQQAFRALNQAVGRCIRHRGDWGAIILVDERFQLARYQQGLSRWVRGAIGAHSSFQAATNSMEDFFKRLKADPPNAPVKLVPYPIPVEPEEPIAEPKTDAIALLMAGHRAVASTNNTSNAGNNSMKEKKDVSPDVAVQPWQQPPPAPPVESITKVGAETIEMPQQLPASGRALPLQSLAPPTLTVSPPQQHHAPNSLYNLVRRAPLQRLLPGEIDLYAGYARSIHAAMDDSSARTTACRGIIDAFMLAEEAMQAPQPCHYWLTSCQVAPPWGVQAVLAIVPHQLPQGNFPLHMEAVSFAGTCLSHVPALDALHAMKGAYEEILGSMFCESNPQHAQQNQYPPQSGGVKRKWESNGAGAAGQQGPEQRANLVGAAAARQAVLEKEALGTASTNYSDNSE